MKEIGIAAQSRGRGGDHQIMSVTVEILYFFCAFGRVRHTKELGLFVEMKVFTHGH